MFWCSAVLSCGFEPAAVPAEQQLVPQKTAGEADSNSNSFHAASIDSIKHWAYCPPSPKQEVVPRRQNSTDVSREMNSRSIGQKNRCGSESYFNLLDNPIFSGYQTDSGRSLSSGSNMDTHRGITATELASFRWSRKEDIF